jgi:hypothetical protein
MLFVMPIMAVDISVKCSARDMRESMPFCWRAVVQHFRVENT